MSNIECTTNVILQPCEIPYMHNLLFTCTENTCYYPFAMSVQRQDSDFILLPMIVGIVNCLHFHSVMSYRYFLCHI